MVYYQNSLPESPLGRDHLGFPLSLVVISFSGYWSQYIFICTFRCLLCSDIRRVSSGYHRWDSLDHCSHHISFCSYRSHSGECNYSFPVIVKWKTCSRCVTHIEICRECFEFHLVHGLFRHWVHYFAYWWWSAHQRHQHIDFLCGRVLVKLFIFPIVFDIRKEDQCCNSMW